MKRVFTLLLCAMVLLLSGCQGRRLQDIKVTSARIVSIVPQGLTELSAVVEVEIHNPPLRWRSPTSSGPRTSGIWTS